ncbi:hypothetical protein EDD15DRAFT_2201339 [Pisolithus albus]|nr:hypothetical protein EDD15DRAFT_2201339 [Pisolithus albus]
MSAFREELDYYNYEMTPGATSFVANDNEFPSSIVQAHSPLATNYMPTMSMGDFFPPSIIQATPSSSADQYPGVLAHASASWGVDGDDAVPPTDTHAMIAPICLPTRSRSRYPQQLPAETIQQISQLHRPNPYPVVSSGIRRVFAYGPRRPSETERGAFVNIGVIRTGSDREITGCRPTRRMLPPSPLDTAHHVPPPPPCIQSPPSQQLTAAAARTISEIEAGQLNKKSIPLANRSTVICRRRTY